MGDSTLIDWAAVGAVAGAFAALSVGRIFRRRQRGSRTTSPPPVTTSKDDLIESCYADFLTQGTRILFMLFENDLLTLHILSDIDFAYFEIDKVKLDAHPVLAYLVNRDTHIYSSSEIDQLLLTPLDAVGGYLSDGRIDIERVRNLFGYYVKFLLKNEKIGAYLNWVRSSTGDANRYCKLADIGAELAGG